ncbi:MAG TPA: hypothetical protein DCF68_02525 [Cyanothece sp. UBA12306]|nr:hypothetical protein [Cyanothece sp. UBA12306]
MNSLLKIITTIILLIVFNIIFINFSDRIEGKEFKNVNHFLPLDQNGWTIYKPSVNSRIIYVSSEEGNDQTAQFYSPNSQEVGQNPFLPAGKVKPFKTIDAALKEARNNSPDWILLKKGDIWYENIKELKNGASKNAPSLVSSYGQDTQRPLLKTDTREALIVPKNIHFAVLSGIDFQGINKSNKNSSRDGIKLVNRKGEQIKYFLLEDCTIRNYKHNLIFLNSGVMKNFVIRRNLILDAYTVPEKKEQKAISSGLLATGANFLLEENIFDHNGWKIQRKPNNDWVDPRKGQATWLNHNTYFPNPRGVIFRENLFLRSSSIQNKWTADDQPGSGKDVIIDNNFYLDGEIGISMGGNKQGPLRFANIKIVNNVMLNIGRSRPTNRNLAWYLEIQDWDGGLVANNLLIHQPKIEVDSTYGILIGGSSVGQTRNVTIKNNLLYNLYSRLGGIVLASIGQRENIQFNNNQIQFPRLKTSIINSYTDLTGFSFHNNKYYSDALLPKWVGLVNDNFDYNKWIKDSARMQWNYLPKKDIDWKMWRKISQDKNSKQQRLKYPNPERTIEEYNGKISGKASYEDFLRQIRKQSKSSWRKEYTADAINDWFREGFNYDKFKLR